jgi:hypothetical protein
MSRAMGTRDVVQRGKNLYSIREVLVRKLILAPAGRHGKGDVSRGRQGQAATLLLLGRVRQKVLTTTVHYCTVTITDTGHGWCSK